MIGLALDYHHQGHDYVASPDVLDSVCGIAVEVGVCISAVKRRAVSAVVFNHHDLELEVSLSFLNSWMCDCRAGPILQSSERDFTGWSLQHQWYVTV